MNSSFWLGYSLENFLFEDFDIESPEDMLAVCIGTIMIVILFEGLKAGRIMKKLKIGSTFNKTSLFKLAFTKPTERSNLLQRSNVRTDSCRKYREEWKVSDIAIHFVELIIGYLIMGIAMTYNGYLMVSICIGALLGYVLYGSVLFNIAAQVIVQRIKCTGCVIKAETQSGNSTPVLDAKNDDHPNALGDDEKPHEDDASASVTYTTVQVHCDSVSRL